MRFLMMLMVVAALTGCATPLERSAQMQREVDEMITAYGPACEKLGYKADTDPWRNCVLQLSTKDSYERGRGMPTMANCIGHRGFLQCTVF